MKRLLSLTWIAGIALGAGACGPMAPGARPATTTGAEAAAEAAVNGDADVTEKAGSEGAGRDTLARSEGGGGIVGAPSSREGIQEAEFTVRMLYWPLTARRTWTDKEDFFRKLGHGELSEAFSPAVEVIYYFLEPITILEETEPGHWGGYEGVSETMVRSQVFDDLKTPGYYLVFMAARDDFFRLDEPKTVGSVDEARSFLNDPRSRFVDEKLVLPAPAAMIRPLPWRAPFPIRLPPAPLGGPEP